MTWKTTTPGCEGIYWVCLDGINSQPFIARVEIHAGDGQLVAYVVGDERCTPLDWPQWLWWSEPVQSPPAPHENATAGYFG
jgi:hypothetical protein